MRANSTTANTTHTTQLGPENHIQQNEWAVASAAQTLLGRVSPNALAVALALAAHVPVRWLHYEGVAVSPEAPIHVQDRWKVNPQPSA